ncbi:MAG: non-canonical purine NTP pyrophosphatase [Patescibacteria group bacterium]
MKIYLASSNQHKLTRLQKIFKKIDPSVEIELVPEYIDVAETGRDGTENSLLKVLPYKEKYQYPVLAGDTAVFFTGENFDPTHVRRAALEGLDESRLTQEEIAGKMIDYYIKLANKYGGQKDFYYTDYWTILFPDGTIKQTNYQRHYILTNHITEPIDIYMPMRNLYLSPATGQSPILHTNEEYYLEFKPQIDAMKKLISCAN